MTEICQIKYFVSYKSMCKLTPKGVAAELTLIFTMYDTKRCVSVSMGHFIAGMTKKTKKHIWVLEGLNQIPITFETNTLTPSSSFCCHKLTLCKNVKKILNLIWWSCHWPLVLSFYMYCFKNYVLFEPTYPEDTCSFKRVRN